MCSLAGSQASPQDRFLVMAAEMDNGAAQELVQFWKDVPKTKVVEHRYFPPANVPNAQLPCGTCV